MILISKSPLFKAFPIILSDLKFEKNSGNNVRIFIFIFSYPFLILFQAYPQLNEHVSLSFQNLFPLQTHLHLES